MYQICYILSSETGDHKEHSVPSFVSVIWKKRRDERRYRLHFQGEIINLGLAACFLLNLLFDSEDGRLYAPSKCRAFSESTRRHNPEGCNLHIPKFIR